MAISILMAAVIITYSNHFHNSLHFDDAHTIESNVFIRDIHNIPKFYTDGSASSSLPSNQSYRPFLTTTLAIDYWMGKGLGDTFYFHLTSFLFFILQGVLMFWLYRRIVARATDDPARDWAALIATAWFMLHPVCAETINYIIQRGDSLSTFFVVLGLVMYIAMPDKRKFYLYLIPVVLGILTKPSALMFAPILFTYILLFEKESSFADVSSWMESLMASAVAFVVCIIGYILVSKMQPSTYVSGASNEWLYRLTQPYIMFTYIFEWFAPIKLNADTDWGAVSSILDPYALLGFSFLILCIYIVVVTSASKATRPIAFGLAWFLISNIPTSIVAFSEITNDHRMFFPFVGLALAVVWSFYLIVKLINDHAKVPDSVRKAFYVCIGLMLVGYAYGTHQRNVVWHNDESLWKDCAEKSPKNGRGLMNYGLTLMSKGDYTGAERYFRDGLVYWPYYSYLHINMAVLKEATGKKEEAEQFYKTGLQYGGNTPGNYYFYARFLKNNQRYVEAEEQLRKALNLSSANMECRYLLMEVLNADHRYEELTQVANATLQIVPNDPSTLAYLNHQPGDKSQIATTRENAKTAEDYINLSLQYYQSGDYQGCVDAAKKAVEMKPTLAAGYNNIGSAYNVMKKYAEAKEALLKALALDPNSQLYKNNLAVSEAGLKEQK